MDYTKTQPYKLGKLYKELGERLMDPRTDLRDLVGIADYLGCNITISLGGEETGPVADNAAPESTK